MDDLTFRSGIDQQGRKIHGGGPLPSQGERHQNRMLRACVTMAAVNAQKPKLRVVVHADGRRAFPDVVQYRAKQWDQFQQAYVLAQLLDLPPTFESHPDPHAMSMAGGGFTKATVPYDVLVHDLHAYERLKAAGALEIGHRLPPAAVPEVIDHRAAPQA